MARIKYYDTDSASWVYADSNSLAIENILELELDYVVAFEADGLFGDSGSAFVLSGDQTGAGGLLHNARITGVEYSDGNDWHNVYSIFTGDEKVVVPMLPLVANDGNDDYTVVVYTEDTPSIDFQGATAIRIHYFKIAGTQTVTPES